VFEAIATLSDMTIHRIREAPIEELLKARGFRQQGKAWDCHSHDDKRPSCTIWKNRLKCWVCNREWSNLDLVMELDACTLPEALRKLAAFYGIPQARMLPKERENYAKATATAPALAVRLADFAHGLTLVIERRIRIAGWLQDRGVDAKVFTEWHRQAYILRKASAADIAAVWRAMPERRDSVERLGQSDREHTQAVTSMIVDLLAQVRRAA